MKPVYKIATSLDRSYLDVEVAVQHKSGVGLRPLPFYVLIIWIAAIFGGLIFIMNDQMPAYNLPPILKLVFYVVLLIFTYFVSSRDKGNQMRFLALRNMYKYMFVPGDRIIKTRNTDPANQFFRLTKIWEVNPKTGLITFTDDTVAYAYRVVGNASSLLFDSDKEAIIDRVDNFFRKMPDNIRCEFVTVKEPQQVATQKLYMKHLYQNLRTRDADMLKIMRDTYDVLDRYVGGDFKSIHQYMLLFASNKSDVDKAHRILLNEVENCGLMISDLEPLYWDDLTQLMRTVYSSEA